MKYLFINSVYGVRSTGRLVAEKCRELTDVGHECFVAYGREALPDNYAALIKIGSAVDYRLHAVASRLWDYHGLCSNRATNELIRQIDEIKPDVIWLHNIHGYYVNYELLFAWLKEHPEIKKYWTLHDCWAFTGHCAYFTMERCEKWKTHCEYCTQLKTYPKSCGIDHSPRNFELKKKSFVGVQNMTLITPSAWLKELVKLSFLSSYEIEVQHNEIDRNVFHPVPTHFKEDKGIAGRYMILGVAAAWEETKGIQDMLALRKLLNDSFVIVLVGVPHRKIKEMPAGVIAIEHTASQKELVEIYSAADVFVNPTHQDNYPTVNLEARACGLPVVTYDVGGSPESAGFEYVVAENDVQGLKHYILELCKVKE